MRNAAIIALAAMLMSTPNLLAQDHIANAIAAARRVDVTDNAHPFRKLDRGYLLMEAAAIVGIQHKAQAEGLINEARRLMESYKGVGHQLVPIVLPLVEQALRGQPLDERKLEEIQIVLKTEKDATIWMSHFLSSTGTFAPDLTVRLLMRLPDAVGREEAFGHQVGRIAMANPGSAWKIAESWPLPTAPNLQFSRAVSLGHSIKLAYDREFTDYPTKIKEQVSSFSRMYFAECEKVGLGKGPHFQLPQATHVALQWFLIDAAQGRKALEQVKNAYRPVALAKTGSWREQWQAGHNSIREQARHAAVLEWLKDPASKTELQKAVDEALALRPLSRQQPPAEPGSVFQRYEYTPLYLVKELQPYHHGMAISTLTALEPLLVKDDGTANDDMWLELASVEAFVKPERAVRFVKNMTDPAKQAKVWLRLATAQKQRAGK